MLAYQEQKEEESDILIPQGTKYSKALLYQKSKLIPLYVSAFSRNMSIVIKLLYDENLAKCAF